VPAGVGLDQAGRGNVEIVPRVGAVGQPGVGEGPSATRFMYERWVWAADRVCPGMTRIIADIPVSLDGLVTGPDPSPDNGLGIGGAPRTLVQRSVISTSTATHLTYDVFR
jgi:hypothetical protein